MPNINENALEQTRKPLADAMEAELNRVAVTHIPMFVCGVNRKINTGNYENIDIYAGISIPVDANPGDIADFKAAIMQAAELGFALTSEETGSRYQLIKDMQKGGRPAKP